VIDADDLGRLLELAEDMADLRAAEAARAEMRETGQTPIPWGEVKADLGLA
jgi:hypothetical protein